MSKPQRGIFPHLYVDDEWLRLRTEDVLDARRPIVDAHHHFWQRASPYFVQELLEDLQCGHNVTGTVFVECTAMYRREGDPRFASVGEVEYVNGIAAEFASGCHGPVRACAGIVGHVDLSLGEDSRPVLESLIACAPDRFRGIRQMAAWDASPEVNVAMRPPPPDLLMNPAFRKGFAQLAPLGLSFDAWVYHPQLPQLIDLVDAYPDTLVVLNHAGGLVLSGPYERDREQTYRQWKRSIQELARRPNVLLKIGGLNSRMHGFDFMDRALPPTSEELAQAWRPTVEICIEAFGPRRSMFESNFPPDKCGCSARVLWNAFKRLTAACSDSEKDDLFCRTAIGAYRLPEMLGRAQSEGLFNRPA